MNDIVQPFHLAFPVDDLAVARSFYRDVLGCSEGRSSNTWVDFNLFGHQIVAHLRPQKNASPSVSSSQSSAVIHNEVDGHDVPVPHFGVVLEMEQWRALAEALKMSGIKFLIEPYVRFEGQVGEQATMFFLDPAGNALEFKAFVDSSQLFNSVEYAR